MPESGSPEPHLPDDPLLRFLIGTRRVVLVLLLALIHYMVFANASMLSDFLTLKRAALGLPLRLLAVGLRGLAVVLGFPLLWLGLLLRDLTRVDVLLPVAAVANSFVWGLGLARLYLSWTHRRRMRWLMRRVQKLRKK